MYANLTPSVTWSLLRGSSTGDVSSTNGEVGGKGEKKGEDEDGKEREREGLR